MPFFEGAQNVDARGSVYNEVYGDQINHFGQRQRNDYPWGPSVNQLPSRFPQNFFPFVDPAQSGHELLDVRSHPPRPLFTMSPSEVPSPLNSPQLPTPVWIPAEVCTDAHIVHDAKLKALDDKLTHSSFEPDISACKNPSEWIQANSAYIASIPRGVIGSVDPVGQDMIYPRLVLYIHTHLTLCTRTKTLLDEFKTILQKWKTWDWLAVIQNHQSIRDDLCRFHQSLDSDLHSKSLFKKLLTLDGIHLAAYLAVVVTDDAKYTILIDQRGPSAQSLINLLQARLDFFVAPDHKDRHVKALIKLCRASGICPEGLFLKDVEIDLIPLTGGGYGDIHKGRLKGEQVAVKVLKIGRDHDRVLKAFASEAVIWRQLSHSNVLPFLGVYKVDDRMHRVCLVSPWLENGNIVEFLNRNGDTDCIPFALDIALGLEYLHGLTLSIIHGDLKGVNVLVTPNGRACLADFGLATVRDTQAHVMSLNSTGRSGGTIRWQAPEFYNQGSRSSSESRFLHSSKETDIYALACVYYEMFSGKLPFHEIEQDYAIITSVMSGRRPARPSNESSRTRGLTDRVWDLIGTCWAQDQTKRPTAARVVEELRALPNRPMDQRPFTDIPVPAASQMGCKATNHPFSALLPHYEDDAIMQELKWLSR